MLKISLLTRQTVPIYTIHPARLQVTLITKWVAQHFLFQSKTTGQSLLARPWGKYLVYLLRQNARVTSEIILEEACKGHKQARTRYVPYQRPFLGLQTSHTTPYFCNMERLRTILLFCKTFRDHNSEISRKERLQLNLHGELVEKQAKDFLTPILLIRLIKP